MNHLKLAEMKFNAYHGVMENEKKVGGSYSVFLKIGYDFEKASQTDCLSDTINYAEIFDLLKEEMKHSSDLIEHVAYRIEKTIIKHKKLFFIKINSFFMIFQQFVQSTSFFSILALQILL